MEKHLSPIIKPDALMVLKQTNNLTLIDVRTGPNVLEMYQKDHLQGALFVDLEQQLAHKSDNAANGGRHPLPSVEQFVLILNQLGINENSHVIVYDDKNGANAAARFWWMLRAVGHQKVQVIDGGMQAAVKAGFPTSDKKEVIAPKTPYKLGDKLGDKLRDEISDEMSDKINAWTLPLVDLKTVEKATHNDNLLIIDVRDTARYEGRVEPIDLIAGHIPNAVNVPFSENLDTDGFYLAPSVLKAKYEAVFDGKASEQVIVHCGSGVTACHTLLAVAYAGMEIPNLYMGSWSEWSRNDLPIATEL